MCCNLTSEFYQPLKNQSPGNRTPVATCAEARISDGKAWQYMDDMSLNPLPFKGSIRLIWGGGGGDESHAFFMVEIAWRPMEDV
jgi:hypothetical protein